MIYDFLTASLLFDDLSLESSFADASDSELKTALRKYREFCNGKYQIIHSEIGGGAGRANVFVDEKLR